MTDLGQFLNWVERRCERALTVGHVEMRDSRLTAGRRGGVRHAKRPGNLTMEAVNMVKAGYGTRDICERLGVHPTTVTLASALVSGKPWARKVMKPR